MKLILCFIERPWAFFTPRSLVDQRIDGAHKIPYEHNAEPIWEDDIVRVAWHCNNLIPICEAGEFHNSPYSVDAINLGQAAPWMTCDPYAYTLTKQTAPKPIWAGIELHDFIKEIQKDFGAVYTRHAVGVVWLNTCINCDYKFKSNAMENVRCGRCGAAVFSVKQI